MTSSNVFKRLGAGLCAAFALSACTGQKQEVPAANTEQSNKIHVLMGGTTGDAALDRHYAAQPEVAIRSTNIGEARESGARVVGGSAAARIEYTP